MTTRCVSKGAMLLAIRGVANAFSGKNIGKRKNKTVNKLGADV